MSYQRLRTHLQAIKVEDHIVAGRKGNKGNIKNKIVIPILQVLGWDLLRDMDFDHQGLDIVLFKQGRASMIVETKSWGDPLTSDINQYLEFSYRLNCPWIFLSSGQESALYCALLNQDDLSTAEPLLHFTLEALADTGGRTLFDHVDAFIGKADFFRRDGRLYAQVAEKLAPQSIEEALIEFVKTASLKVREDRSRQLTVESFLAQLRHHSRQVSGALVYLHQKIINLLQINDRLTIRYRNKGVGLEYETIGNPGAEALALLDIYPENARITIGQEGWRKLNITVSTFERLVSQPRTAESFAWAREVGAVLEKAVREITIFP